jgi:hypothetical protein
MVVNVTLLNALAGGRTHFLSWSQSGSGRDVVNVLHDVGGHMIGFCRDILIPVPVFPDVKFRNKKVFNLFSRGIKLDPLEQV